MHIALLGGSFDPVHLGHLSMAVSALEAWNLDRVLLMPSATTPHKRSGAAVATEHRVRMLRAAVRGVPGLGIALDEVRRGGISYTFDTLSALCSARPHDRVGFILGLDSLLDIAKWYRGPEIAERFELLPLARPGVAVPRHIPGLPKATSDRLLASVRPGRLMDISSTEIRKRLAESRPVCYLVPYAVERYIRRHGLYGTA